MLSLSVFLKIHFSSFDSILLTRIKVNRAPLQSASPLYLCFAHSVANDLCRCFLFYPPPKLFGKKSEESGRKRAEHAAMGEIL